MDPHVVCEQLDEAEQRVRLGEKHIARQMEIVAYLTRRGYPVQLAMDLLETYRSLQSEHVQHRDRLAAALGQAPLLKQKSDAAQECTAR